MEPPKAAHNNDWREEVKELAAGVSMQAQVANRVWLALMTAAFVGVLPLATKAGGRVTLPFGLGDVDQTLFYPLTFSILVVLTIAFAAAHAQPIRAANRAHKAIDNEIPEGQRAEARANFDMLRLPSLNRVAPLAQLLAEQFTPSGVRRPWLLRLLTWLVKLVTVAYYVLLKLVSLLVSYGLPAIASVQIYTRVSGAGWVGALLSIGGVIAGLALLHVVLSDLGYSLRVIRRLWQGPEPRV